MNISIILNKYYIIYFHLKCNYCTYKSDLFIDLHSF